MQRNMLEFSKTVAESMTQMLFAVREAGGNPAATAFHPAVDEHLRNAQVSISLVCKSNLVSEQK